MDAVSHSLTVHLSPRPFSLEVAVGPWRPDFRFTTRCAAVLGALHAYGPGTGSIGWTRMVAGSGRPREEIIERHGDGYVVVALEGGEFLVARVDHGQREAPLRWGSRRVNTGTRWRRADLEALREDGDVSRLPGWSPERRAYAIRLVSALPMFLDLLHAEPEASRPQSEYPRADVGAAE